MPHHVCVVSVHIDIMTCIVYLCLSVFMPRNCQAMFCSLLLTRCGISWTPWVLYSWTVHPLMMSPLILGSRAALSLWAKYWMKHNRSVSNLIDNQIEMSRFDSNEQHTLFAHRFYRNRYNWRCNVLFYAELSAPCSKWYIHKLTHGTLTGWLGCITVRASDLRSSSHGFDSRSSCCQVTTRSCSHPCASVTKQYNLVPAKRRWRSVVGKVTVGLALHRPCVTDFVVYPPTGSVA